MTTIMNIKMMKLLRPVGAAILTTLLIGCSSDAPLTAQIDPDSLRQTQYGPVVGGSDDNTYRWLNIPFATPPLNELRWKAPREPQPWTANREAIKYGQPCTQFWGMLSGVDGSDGDIVGSEDCLNLNVWAPKDLSDTQKLPVMVWIHGGGNTVGTANTYQGHRLADDQKVIYVGINYRLGLFGSFAHQSLKNTSDSAEDASGNYAVLDIIAALQWVQGNIAEFGGDINNVTIFGESAGGRNVYSMLASPLAKGLFHKAIIQSGSTHSTDITEAEAFRTESGQGYANSSNEILAQVLLNDEKAYDLASAKGLITTQSDQAIADYLHKKSPQELMGHISTTAVGMFPAPQSLADGYVLPKQSLLSLLEDETRFNSVPTLLGSNRDENKIFMAQDPQWVDQFLGFLPRISNPEKYHRYASYFSQQWKTLAVDEPAERLSRHNPTQTFAYRFDWDNTPSSWLADFPALLGAGHGLEISFIFGDFEKGMSIPYLNTEDNLDDRLTLSNAMMNYWGNFAHHGTPASGSNGKLPEWKPWASSTENLMLLDGSEDQGVAMTTLRLSAADLKQRFAEDLQIQSQQERCQLYAQSFLVSFQAQDFWNESEYKGYGDGGCSNYNPYDFGTEH
jgi:para-nitrobenzyl esterase